MNTHTNGTNGKLLARPSLVLVEQPPKGSKPNLERIFMLCSEVINLEAKLSDVMNELTTLSKDLDSADLPKLLIALMRQPGINKSVLATLPVLEEPIVSRDTVIIPPPPERPVTLTEEFKQRIVVLMGDGRERKAEAIIKALKAKKQKSTVYLALSQLVEDNALIRPAFAHYRRRA